MLTIVQRLYLKSQDNPSDGPGSNNIVLCTNDKTYNVRQVSTSNSLFVVQPSHQGENAIAQSGLDAIAQCLSTLEVQLDSSASAISFLSTALPKYTSTGHHGPGNSRSKRELFDHLPMSNRECERDWNDLACFELDGIALLPSDSVKLKVWQAILTNATAHGLDLTESLGPGEVEQILDNDSEWPWDLSNAILDSVLASKSSLEALELDGTKLARSIGLSLLKDRTDDGRRPISAEAFQTSWADLMPEKWRSNADISLLGGSIGRESGGTEITFVTANVTHEGASSAAPTDAKTGAGAKRKWHEKFRAAKKAA